MKSWVLNGDVLEVTDGETRIPALADQVYESIIEGVSAWPDLPAGKCGEAKSLQFSRYPVDLTAVIAVDKDSGWPILSFEARTQKGECFRISQEAAALGHVVNKQVWYPGAIESAEDIAKLLAESDYDFSTGRPRKLSGFLVLKRAATHGGPVIDRLPSDALTNLVFKTRKERSPKGIRGELYPYQLDGWCWLRFVMREHLGGLLADEMGLGKTLQVISALRDPGGKKIQAELS